MAEELKAKGSIKLALNLAGRDLATLKELNSAQEVTLTGLCQDLVGETPEKFLSSFQATEKP